MNSDTDFNSNPTKHEILRQRLLQIKQSEFKSYKSLVNAILECEAVDVNFQIAEGELSRGQKWDAYQEIKEETVRRILNKTQTEITPVYERAFFQYLVFRKHLTLEEYRDEQSDSSAFIRSIIEEDNSFLLEKSNRLSSKILFRFRSKLRFVERRSTIFPSDSKSAIIRACEVFYKRVSGESASSFHTRVGNGIQRRVIRWEGLAAEHDTNTVGIHFRPMGSGTHRPFFALIEFPPAHSCLISSKSVFFKNISTRKYSIFSNIKQIKLRNAPKDDIIILSQKARSMRSFASNKLVRGFMKFDEKIDPIIDAAQSGNTEFLFKCIVNGSDLNATEPETGRTAAHIFARNSDAIGISILYPCNSEFQDFLNSDTFDWEKLGGRDLVEARWKAALENRNPLTQDNDGMLPSSLFPIIKGNSFAAIESRRIHSMMFFEERLACEKLGINLEIGYKNTIRYDAANPAPSEPN